MSDPKNYEDLKAKLGIKKREVAAPTAAESPSPAAGAPSSTETTTQHTPPGGFDLGLERGRQSAAAPLVDIKDAEVQIKSSSSTRMVIAFLILLACGGAFGVGYVVQGTAYDRRIEIQQKEDATNLLAAVKSIKAGPKAEPLDDVTGEFITAINSVAKKVEDLGNAETVTPALLKSIEKQLEDLRIASITYVEKAPRLGDIFPKELFNGAALRIVLNYDDALEKLYNAAYLMAGEKGVLVELQTELELSGISVPPKTRHFRWATIAAKDGSPRGYLVGVKPVLDKDSKFVTQTLAPQTPPGMMPDPAATPTTQIKVKYDDPKLVGKEEDWIDSDKFVEYELKPDIEEDVKLLVTQQQGIYEQMLLRRLFERVTALRNAAEAIPIARQKMIDGLTKLAE